MNLRTRKFIGVILILASIALYGWVATLVYETWLTGASPLLLILFFAVAGGGWFFPATWIIRFMARPDDQAK